MFRPNNKGQSLLEYAILLGVIVAGLLIMQAFIKRGYQGGLKESADKMGEQYSASGTSIIQERRLTEPQVIKEEVTTNTIMMKKFVPAASNVIGTVAKGAYSYTDRSSVGQISETKTKTESANLEKSRLSDYTTGELNEAKTDFDVSWSSENQPFVDTE